MNKMLSTGKIIFLFAIMLFCIEIIEAGDQSIKVNYSFSNRSYYETSLSFSSFLMRISTDRDATCRYDSRLVGYSDMSGRFDLSGGKSHDKSFTNLGDGIYRYYVKCAVDELNISSEPLELEINVRVNSLVTGQVALEKQDPLGPGKIQVTLITSKTLSQTPYLASSLDSLVYNPIPLLGSDKVWKGYLIIPKNAGESVLSFKFRANDLEGRQGDELTSGSVFVVDTVKPIAVSDFKAVGYDGQIKLSWRYTDEAEEFKIYRDTSPNTDYVDYYKSVNGRTYTDVSVERGKTYYYRIAPVDEAGNEADFSVEAYATPLLGNISSSTGLALELRGQVDSLVSEIDSILGEIETIKNALNQKQEKERDIFIQLKLDKERDNSKSELSALRRDVVQYNSQDLTKIELEKKLSSSSVKLDLIKKKVPESITILEESSDLNEITREIISEALFELNPLISDSSLGKSTSSSLQLIKDSGLKVKSSYYVVESVYLDGSRKQFSLVKRDISATLERKENASFLEIVPKELEESASNININNLDYSIVKEDPVISFSSDTKSIAYFFNKRASLSSLQSIKFALVSVSEADKKNAGITGYFIFDAGKRGYFGFVIGIAALFILGSYFVYIRRKRNSLNVAEVKIKISEAMSLAKKGEINGAKRVYGEIREAYSSLDSKEKWRVYEKIEKLRKEIVLFRSKNED